MMHSTRLALLDQLASAQQDVFEVELRGKRVIFLNAVPLIREFLLERAEHFEKSDFQMSVIGRGEDQTKRGLGNGLLTSSDEVHKEQARVMGAAFDQRSLTRYADRMAAAAARVQARWPTDSSFDIAESMMTLSTAIIGETLFSTDFDGNLDTIARMLLTVTTRLGRPARERGTALEEASVLADTHTLLRQTFGKIIEYRNQHPETGERDIITLLLEAQKKTATQQTGPYTVTYKQLADDIMTLLFAGSENPKNALSWTFYLLSRHPEVYDRVRQEAHQVLGGRLPTHDDLGALPYTLAVFKEVLRLYPPGYAFGRRALSACKVGHLEINPDDEVVVSPYALHRRADYFSDPEVFNPERFMGGDSAAMTRTAFLPFGAGPRSCIGAQYSLVEGQIVLATLAQGPRLALSPDTQDIYPEPRITLRPAPGVWMKVVS